jgi:hypothetical protein
MVDPRLASIPEAVIELVPESVARELCVLAFRTDGTRLWVFCPFDPDFSARESGRLSIILHRQIEWVPVDQSLLQQAINESYLPWHEAIITNCPHRLRFQCPKNWLHSNPLSIHASDIAPSVNAMFTGARTM